MGAFGLALAQSVMAGVEVAILFVVISMRIPGLLNGTFWNGVWRMASATGFMAIISYIMVLIFPLQAGDDSSFYFTFPKFVLIVFVSLASYVAFSRLLKLHEVDPVIRQYQKVVAVLRGTKPNGGRG